MVVINLLDGLRLASLSHGLLQHPSGLTVVPGPVPLLLVQSQDQRLILAWEITNRTWFVPLGVWRQDLPPAPEGLTTIGC